VRSPHTALRPTAAALAALLTLALAGCSAIGDLFSGDKVDYRSASARTKPLDVPPDLTQLARESRYQVQGGAITASSVAAAVPAAVPAAPAAAVVAPGRLGEMRIERAGQQRWLVVPTPPEQLWPQLRQFWERAGFTLTTDNPQAGVMETNWAENRAKLPADVVRNTLGRVLGNLYDTGERDLFRTRVERNGSDTEIYISHRGIQEDFADTRRESTVWRARPSDKELEAEFLARLMVALAPPAGTTTAAAPAAAGTAPGASTVAAAPEATPRARLLTQGDSAAMEVDEPFDRAWRRVGLALDRGGFTVEDRDRAQGLYYVRWVDPRVAGQEEPNFFARLFGGARDPQTPVRYRISLKGEGNKTRVSVLTSAGAPEAGENGKRIVAQLVGELR
jgi:outer membrane protein assembly factor BamC